MGDVEKMDLTEDVTDRGSLLLRDCIEKIGLSGDLSDVTFIFPKEGNKMIHAHKFVLSARSSVFRTMFYGSLPEKGDIRLENQSSRVFQAFLRFLYTDEIDIDKDIVTELLYTSKLYGVTCLTEKCDTFLEEKLAVDNACTILNHASLYDLKKLFAEVILYIEINAVEVLQAEDFKTLSRECLSTLLESDNLTAPEASVLKSVLQWAEHQCYLQNLEQTGHNKRIMLGDLLYKIRVPCLKLDDFSDLLAEIGVLTNEEELCFYRHYTKGSTTGDLGMYLMDTRKGKPLLTIDLIGKFGKATGPIKTNHHASESLTFNGGNTIAILRDIEFHDLRAPECVTGTRSKPVNIDIIWKQSNESDESIPTEVIKLKRECKIGKVRLNKEIPVNTTCELKVNIQKKCDTCGEISSLPYSEVAYSTQSNRYSSGRIYKKYHLFDGPGLRLEIRGAHIVKSVRIEQNPSKNITSDN